MLDAFLTAIAGVTSPIALAMLVTGVVTGLILGVLPGVGGLFGLVVLVPFTYHLDPYAAFALLIGVSAVTSTSDTIPAVLLGVPGTVSAIATVEDGHPLARQNQALRALGAAYSASLIGGIFGAAVIALSIPVLRPLVLAMKTPDFLAISVIGMFFVAFVSGSDALKGLGALLLGALVSFVGLDANMGAERFTGGMIYLWDGIPLSILFLGVFGLPELAALLDRKSIAEFGETGSGPTLMDGVRDTLREWKLVLQCSSIGAIVGAVPGVGVTVIDWIAYGVAKRDRRGGPEFGQGNIRGVIAPESANNAKEGGYLIPTLALGLPGSVTMTILLGAFTVQGLLPGPGMLKENLSITYSMVISLTLANILGASICMLLSRGLARLTMLPATTIFSVALVFVMLGAFYTHAIAEDILCLGLAASLGIWMKAWNWSRAAFSLGFVLGPNVERYFFLSYQLNGMSWLTRPSIIAVGVIMVWMAVRRIRAFRQVRASDAEMTSPVPNIASFGLLGLGSVWAIASLWSEEFPTRIFPQIAAVLMILVSAVLIGREYLVWRRRKAAPAPDTTAVLHDHHPWAMIATGAKALGALAALAVLSFAFGHLPAAALFVGTVLTVRDRRLRLANVLVALGTALAIYAVFDALMSVPWPRPWLAGVPPGY